MLPTVEGCRGGVIVACMSCGGGPQSVSVKDRLAGIIEQNKIISLLTHHRNVFPKMIYIMYCFKNML